MSRNIDASGSDYIDVGTGQTFADTSTWSMMMFARIEDTTGVSHCPWAKAIVTGMRMSLRIENEANPADLHCRQGGINRFSVANAINDNTWYLFALTNDGADTATSLTLYVGEMDGTLSSNTGDHFNNGGDAHDLWFGENQDNNVTWEGDLAYAAYFTIELSADQVRNYLYNPVQTAGMLSANCSFFLPLGLASPEPDLSGNGVTGTITGSTTITDMPPVSPFAGWFSSPIATALAGGGGPLVDGDLLLKLVNGGLVR